MPTVTFGLPLRSQRSTQNWTQISALFDATLRSILAQTDGDFRVILACHEVPDVPGLDDARVTTVQADFPAPVTFADQMVDKAMKRRLVGATLRAQGGGYLMMVDADDLVSNQLVAFVRRDASPHGYILKSGYELDAGTGRMRIAPRFDQLCGTSAIVHFREADLPIAVQGPKAGFYLSFTSHTEYESNAREHNRPLVPLPFPGAVYVMNHGENHSVQAGNVGWKRKLLRQFIGGKPPVRALREEFGIGPIVQPSTRSFAA